MAKLHDKSSKPRTQAANPGSLLAIVQTFLDGCKRPSMLEAGEELIPLREGSYTIEASPAHVVLEVWDEQRSVCRRIIDVEKKGPGVLDCTIARFGGAIGRLTLLDSDRPQTTYRVLRGNRETFAEQFRRMITRQFPGWEIAHLGAAPDLQRSFSPVFPRARLECGNRVIAALACLEPQNEPAMLSFALIWFDHLRGHSPAGSVVSLILFLPESSGRLTAHRLRFLDHETLAARIFLFNENGSAGEVDPLDLGNLETQVSGQHDAAYLRAEMQDAAFPERWFESRVRENIQAIDASLLPGPIHGQVLTLAGGDRDLIDLLAISHSGRLAVLELKCSEDIHLPLQALDYWTRIKWHAERQELAHLFPEARIQAEAPKLLLIAPAMAFHPSNKVVLRYFSPEIEVERVGVNSGWREELRVVMRLRGSSVPQSHT